MSMIGKEPEFVGPIDVPTPKEKSIKIRNRMKKKLRKNWLIYLLAAVATAGLVYVTL
jgi:hypothetical protein